MARDIRQRALEKIASLSAASPRTSFDRSDLDRLCKATQTAGKGVNGHSAKQPSSSLGRCPMTIREFEVLLSLCKAAPAIQTSQSAQKLAHQLIPYILEAHVQVFVPSPFFRKVEPSPTEALAFHVTAALLSLGSHYDDLHEIVSDNIWAFVNACNHAADHTVPPQADDEDPNLEDAIRTATIAVSLLGFLDAASAQVDFWRAGAGWLWYSGSEISSRSRSWSPWRLPSLPSGTRNPQIAMLESGRDTYATTRLLGDP
ncbi:pephosphatidylinositol 3 [Colletotrichum higginsianum]|nr:pephosphatidylinositol 3 [Colletotrichum higginsianum]